MAVANKARRQWGRGLGVGMSLLWLLGACLATANEKIIIGAVEDVMLLPWGIRLPSRIDTGAATSSLDVRGLTLYKDHAEFWVPDFAGGRHMRLPVSRWEYVRSPAGEEVRPVVEVDLCLGTSHIRTLVNLHDRSKMTYPLLIGRNILSQGYVVDVSRELTFPPQCVNPRRSP